MNLLSCLLPDATHVRLETWALEPAQSAITINLRARLATARCPLCGRRSKRVHSRYGRTPADLPWGEHAVTVQLSVRRLFCDNARCERRLSAERLPDVALPWARKTTRLAGRLTAVGLALGGAAGMRLGRKLGLNASRNTLLRLTRRAPLPDVATPSALGVNDWAEWPKVPRATRVEWPRRDYANGTPTAPCWSTSTSTVRWRCCPAARRTRWQRGCASTPASR